MIYDGKDERMRNIAQNMERRFQHFVQELINGNGVKNEIRELRLDGWLKVMNCIFGKE